LETGRRQAPPRIALTGGIGSGKSTALTLFAVRKAAVLNSDHIVHRLLQRRDVRERVAEKLGLEHVASGEAGRQHLADVVFADEELLDRLQDFIFPLVRAETEEWFNTEEVRNAPLAVVELPMLFEAEMEKMFDYVILITAPVDLRRTRHAGHVSKADFERRAAHQLPEEEKRSRADFVYENTGSPEELDDFVAQTIDRVTGGSRTKDKKD